MAASVNNEDSRTYCQNKTPFIIGVAGGTASGKVFIYLVIVLIVMSFNWFYIRLIVNGLREDNGEIRSGQCRQ
jgi:pantothenate kinase-related protein Tda10